MGDYAINSLFLLSYISYSSSGETLLSFFLYLFLTEDELLVKDTKAAKK